MSSTGFGIIIVIVITLIIIIAILIIVIIRKFKTEKRDLVLTGKALFLIGRQGITLLLLFLNQPLVAGRRSKLVPTKASWFP